MMARHSYKNHLPEISVHPTLLSWHWHKHNNRSNGKKACYSDFNSPPPQIHLNRNNGCIWNLDLSLACCTLPLDLVTSISKTAKNMLQHTVVELFVHTHIHYLGQDRSHPKHPLLCFPSVPCGICCNITIQ